MNRSIFIVIVDFLLLSLVTFARFDSLDTAPKRTASSSLTANSPARDKDMVDVLKVSLEQERQAREKLHQQLNQTQEALRSREDLLVERDRRILQSQETLQRKDQETQRLAAERAALEAQYGASRSNLTTMQAQLAASSNEARLSRQRLTAMETELRKHQEELAAASAEAQTSKERLAAMQAEVRKQQAEFEAASSEARVSKEVLAALEADLRQKNQESLRMQKNLQEIEQKRQATEAEKQKLATQLQVTAAEQRIFRDQLDNMRGTVQTAQAEKARLMDQTAKLTKEVSSLADKSQELKKEIQETRPLAANTFFNEYYTNRIQSSISASRRGILGQHVERDKQCSSVLVTDGTNTFALLHIDDTPLSLGNPGTDWERLMGSLRRGVAIVSVGQVSFWAQDPRVVLMPLDRARAQALGVKVYPVAKDPFKFQEAILVGAKENYYGECRFQVDPENPEYVRMDRNIFKRLVGNFAPSGGDLVFSKTGQIIGVMVNKEYCALVTNFAVGQTLRTGVSIADQEVGKVLAAMWLQLNTLPFKLQ